MKPGGGRAKGHAFEREIAHKLADVFGEAKRGLSQCRGGTAEEPDVVLPDGVPFFVECKRQRRPNIVRALEQAQEACEPNRWAVAICQADREQATATMCLDDFTVLIREWWELRQQAAHVAAAGDELAKRLEASP